MVYVSNANRKDPLHPLARIYSASTSAFTTNFVVIISFHLEFQLVSYVFVRILDILHIRKFKFVGCICIFFCKRNIFH